MGYQIRAIDETKTVRVIVAITTDVVEEARRVHNLSKTAAATLGRTLTMTAIMGTNLKNEKDSLTVSIKGNGDAGTILATAKNDGNVKGYIENPMADRETRQSDGKLDVSGLVGDGFLTVTMDTGLKEPYVGRVPLVSGEIAEDFANYFTSSDQVPSAVGLGVLVDVDYTIKAAGGFLLQLMPGVEEDTIDRIEKNLSKISRVTSLIEEGKSAEDILNIVMEGFNMQVLERQELSYRCDCSKEKVGDAIVSIGPKEIEDMIIEDGKAHVSCYFCDKEYNFNREELEELLAEAKNINKY